MKDTGGHAFPWTGAGVEGMTLRDYFAAQALQGLLANPKLMDAIVKEGGAYGGWVEESAWGWADALLKARDK